MASPVIFTHANHLTSELLLDNIKMNFGILDESKPDNITSLLLKYPYHVLIQKIAFSCNYRDKTILLETASAKSHTSQYAFFGSDFVGLVIAKGAKARIKVGCRVIPNSSYPIAKNGMPGIPSSTSSREFEIINSYKLLEIPEDIPSEVAAGFTIGFQTTYSIIRRLHISNKKIYNALIWSSCANTSLFFAETLTKYSNVNFYGVSRSLMHRDKLMKIGYVDIFEKKTFIENNEYIDYFDFIFDPFADLNFYDSLDLLKIGGKYVTCGLLNQFNILDNSWKLWREEEAKFILPKLIYKNINVIGNCLGNTMDLKKAIVDYKDGKLNFHLHSKYKNENVCAFIYDTFCNPHRFGKVIYLY